jgi:hypothetical protein
VAPWGELREIRVRRSRAVSGATLDIRLVARWSAGRALLAADVISPGDRVDPAARPRLANTHIRNLLRSNDLHVLWRTDSGLKSNSGFAMCTGNFSIC